MTAAAKTILESFDKLPEREKREMASAILRRALRFDLPPLTDDDLVAQADELFRELDEMDNSPILNVQDVEYTNWGIGGAFEAQLGAVANRIGAKKLGYRVVVLALGKKAWPFHLHHVNEEMFLVLEGTGMLRFDDRQYPVKAGDIIACPPGPGTAHQIVNTSHSELKYLAVSTMEAAEVAEYPDSGKFAALVGRAAGGDRTQRAFWTVGRKDAGVDYWDGES